jgi:hypothetical protein
MRAGFHQTRSSSMIPPSKARGLYARCFPLLIAAIPS